VQTRTLPWGSLHASLAVFDVEKSFTRYRSGANTNASLDRAGGEEAFNTFLLENVYTFPLNYYVTASAMASDLYMKWTQGFSLAVDVIALRWPSGRTTCSP
jgi:hypothetical protein